MKKGFWHFRRHPRPLRRHLRPRRRHPRPLNRRLCRPRQSLIAISTCHSIFGSASVYFAPAWDQMAICGDGDQITTRGRGGGDVPYSQSAAQGNCSLPIHDKPNCVSQDDPPIESLADPRLEGRLFLQGSQVATDLEVATEAAACNYDYVLAQLERKTFDLEAAMAPEGTAGLPSKLVALAKAILALEKAQERLAESILCSESVNPSRGSKECIRCRMLDTCLGSYMPDEQELSEMVEHKKRKRET